MSFFFLPIDKIFSTNFPRIWASFFSTLIYMTSSEEFNVRKLWTSVSMREPEMFFPEMVRPVSDVQENQG